MGYRVGFQCLESSESAHDYVLSQVQPLLLPDGTFLRPEKVGNQWVLNGSPLVLSFPECSVSGQIKDGAAVGAAFVSVFVLMFGFKVIKNMIYGGGKNDD